MIDTVLAPAVVGLTLLEREVALTRMARTVGNPVAKAAIDMAMWDALGRTLDLSVRELLGGYTHRMRVCHMLGFDTPAAIVDQAVRMNQTFGVETSR